MRTGSLKRFALAMCAVFVLAVAFSIGIQLVHANHHCDDGKCPLCVAYQGAQLVMRALGLAVAARAAQLLWQLARRATLQPGCPNLLLSTPVSLSIRMND